MEKFQKVKSTEKPESKVIDDYSVWIAENVTEIIEEPNGDENTGFTGYEFDLIQYSKDEYIELISDKNESLEVEITNTQTALCEVYELLG